jgi:adenylate cyclase class 2
MLEIELKFPGADLAQLERQLLAWGAKAQEPQEEADHYFNAPDRDFAHTDEAVRLRRKGSANFITYKGPKQGLQGKTRTEIEVPLADGAAVARDLVRFLEGLGYRSVAEVRKRRQIYRLDRSGFSVEVCLDEVRGLGKFAEIEIKAPLRQLKAAQRVLTETAAALGLGADERRSYLELLLAAREKKAVHKPHKRKPS